MNLLKLFEEPGMVALTPREAAAVREALTEAANTRTQLTETRALVADLQAQVERTRGAAEAAKSAREEVAYYTQRLHEISFRCDEYERLIHEMLGKQTASAYITGVEQDSVEKYYDGLL
jgi:hypothetical protein